MPYKGITSAYGSIQVGETMHQTSPLSYDLPTRQLVSIAALTSFYNEKVDIFLNGHGLDRPTTHFFKAAE